MSNEYVVEAELRADKGKGASRRLRRLENKVPAILYGENKEPVMLSLALNKIMQSLNNEGFYSHILTINYDGKSESAILKDLQRHPASNDVTHADFLRVSKDHAIHVNVPLHFINEAACAGVKTGGGVISHQMTEVEVICLPGDLPEFIEVDMTDVEAEQIVHLTDLTVPAGVTIAALQQGEDHDLPVVSVHKPKGAKADEEEEAGEE
ncbi:MAG: 50S ribosomal protein L25/general stress protein Ctc [Pseudomonadales bacterium]|uniref:Large ribosomal subunit protein bL25 n=1 Tax=Oleiphilus messinensis TaxID=141451 RepID=A0A1Y0I460_9GAMM|nr:50S ribosomal protein L25/general stress protein Ctc [Oleiphilus messinensis]ARU55262.1 50S ribosomal subunit protein L25 [Oleiphilus messinensis]MCG8612117.1 50S ribosomal protein L25/general stress protein Ctc [Pseudomonadales bacterium]